MKVYLSNAMRGHPNYNFEAFWRDAKVLRDLGHEVKSPAEMDIEFNICQVFLQGAGDYMGTEPLDAPHAMPWTEFKVFKPVVRHHPGWSGTDEQIADMMEHDYDAIDWCEAIILGDDWRTSTGAGLELAYAIDQGKEVWRIVGPPDSLLHFVFKPAHHLLERTAFEELMAYKLPPVPERRLEVGPLDRSLRQWGMTAEERAQDDAEQRATVHVPTIIGSREVVMDPDMRALARELEKPIWGDTVSAGEVRVTSVTGGQKGSKLAQFNRLPWDVVWELAEHYAKGSQKYPDAEPGVANWQLGYDWSLSINALVRHLAAWFQGEEYGYDEALGGEFPHLIAAMWHVGNLRYFEKHEIGTDDRYYMRDHGE